MNYSPSNSFVLFYIKYLESKCFGLEAVSQYILAYVEPTPSRAHHPTCPWIEIPGDWWLLHHISLSLLTATVWSLLMNSNRPLLYVIIWCTANITNFMDLCENFCHATPESSNMLYLHSHRGRNLFLLICSI